MIMDAQQELFTAVKLALEAKGYDVYDTFLPPDGTPYPFIYLGSGQQVEDNVKIGFSGSVFQHIDVWHNDPGKRGTVSAILLDIKRIMTAIKTDHFGWMPGSISQDIRPDETTQPPLLRGLLDIELKYTR